MEAGEIKKMLKAFHSFLGKKQPNKTKVFLYKIYKSILSMFFSLLPSSGISIMDEKWDYLIILDACRYDDFKLLNDIPGILYKKKSQGSSTREWLKNNFKEYYSDIVYISSNPFISGYETVGWKGTEHFLHVENVWDYGWSDELGTVPPSEVTQAAIKMINKYPGKKMIVHYIQPHGPWIGETRLSALEVNGHMEKGGRHDYFIPVASYFWDLFIAGILPLEKIRQAYVDNLKLVLSEVKKLLPHLSGKIIVSADHGTAFGEWGVYAHPKFFKIKALNEIPWLEIQKTSFTHDFIDKQLDSSKESLNNLIEKHVQLWRL